jgi:hypothetical protein
MFHRHRLRRPQRKAPDRKAYLFHRKAADELIRERLAHFVREYARLDPKYGQIMNWSLVTVRNQRSRWGSCSVRRTLSFNWRIALMSPHLRDYVIVHELCHLVEFNHSPAFWGHVRLLSPDASRLRAELKKVRT